MFDLLPISSLVLGVVGSLLSLLVVLAEKRRFWGLVTLRPGHRILLVFALIVAVFGIVTVVRYWDRITQYENTLYYVGWLLLTMIAGMFAQVLSSNYTSGKPLFEVTVSQLVYPLLFALVVFYPVWAVAASAPQNLFSFYAAFLNGFFWETVVANTRPPTQASPQENSAKSRSAA